MSAIPSEVVILNKALLTRRVNRLGEIESQLKALEAEKAELLAEFKEAGTATYKGTSAVLEITQFERPTVGYAAIVKALGDLVPADLVKANTKVSVVTQAKVKLTVN